MASNQKNILWFKDIRLKDISPVGGKNASLGEMFSQLKNSRIVVPDGFAVTTNVYRSFIHEAGLKKGIQNILRGLNTRDVRNLKEGGAKIRKLIINAEMPESIAREIISCYRKLGGGPVAVRSSATAEDLPGASFAGQQETYLDIEGESNVVKAIKRCFASLFTDRAISYRHDKGFFNTDVAISVGVQKMVRADRGASGVMFTVDTETGFKNAIIIEATRGLGEAVVQGKVNPDKFIVFKPTLQKGKFGIISKEKGDTQKEFSLNDAQVEELAKLGIVLEKYFSRKNGKYTPMDIEWAAEGKSIYILQARPETVFGGVEAKVDEEYVLQSAGRLIFSGSAVGRKIVSGRVRIIKDASQIESFKKGEILVTRNTDPDWEPIMKIAGGIITDKGGRTSHAAIVSREMGVPCIVGTHDATKRLKNGDIITLDSSSGNIANVYKGELPFKIIRQGLKNIPRIKTRVMLNIGSPEEAFKNANLPVRGVGLGRLEFIINSSVKAHPNLLIKQGKKEFYVDKLTEGIAKIASAFYPYPVIIRFSDFKTNEYRSLLGGETYEPLEENPMLGWRGASRYYSPDFEEAFRLECQAIKRVREVMGLDNVIPMVPFCRTPEEGRRVLEIMGKAGLKRGVKDLKVYMMCEIPSNVILADKFLDIFDGMSIGSNDLTQLIMGMDRDSEKIAGIANENHAAVREAVKDVIKKCRARKKYIGICGQAPSDHPDFLKFLIKEGIESISLNPDSVIKAIRLIAKAEKNLPQQK